MGENSNPWFGDEPTVMTSFSSLQRPDVTHDDAAQPVLLVLSGPAIGEYFAFPKSESQIFVGRGDDVHFKVNDSSVSRRHARFLVQHGSTGDCQVQIEDLGSTNGCRVDGRRIERPTPLQDGDKLQLGDLVLRFQQMDRDDIAFQDDVARQVRSASRDPLTGLLTRRYLDEHLPTTMRRHAVNRAPLALAIIDLDHFKLVNDTYGHLVGDDVLHRTAVTLQEQIRDADAAVRYGGEEFCVILAGADRQLGEQIANRIRRAIEHIDLRDLNRNLRCTASIGVAVMGEGEELSAWIERADNALYRAKDAGRNQVQLARPFQDLGSPFRMDSSGGLRSDPSLD